jgi:hypothetical protein
MEEVKNVKDGLTKIEVARVNEIEYVDKETGKKKKFTAYKAVTKGNKLIDLKFTMDCVADCRELIPTKPCFIYVKPFKWNVQRNVKYPVLWVHKIELVEEYPTKDEEDLF